MISDYVQRRPRVQVMQHFYHKYRNKNIQKQIYRTELWMQLLTCIWMKYQMLETMI